MVANLANLHNWGHEDYDEAKRDIFAQLGRLDLEIFGRQVLVGVYVRPAYNARSKLHATGDEQKKDWWENKVVLVLAHGPDAFTGDDGYMKANYPDGRRPRIGDWLFQNANQGMSMNFKGDGAERVKYEDRRGEMQDRYPDEGWPVRIVMDDSFLGRVMKPNQVI